MSAPAAAAGKKGACPECHAVMEIPITSLEGKLGDIRDGKCVVLIMKAEYHQAEKGRYYRFRCRVCDQGLSIPADKVHKKIQCTSCEAVSRLSLTVVQSETEIASNQNSVSPATKHAVGSSESTAELEDPNKIQFECRDCRQQVRVPKEHAGKKGRCPNCRTTVEIPYYSTTAGFRVKQSSVKPLTPVNTVNVSLAGPDLLKNFVPELPLKAGSWSLSKPSAIVKHAEPKQTAVKREGLPWENPPEQGGRFWPTCKLLLFSPNVAFQQMYEDDGLGNPIGFAVVGHLLATLLFALAMVPVLIVACLLAEPHMANGIDYPELAALFGIGIGIWFGVGLLLIPLLMFCFGAMLHAAAFVVGGSDKPFATTNRMMAYSLGASLQTLAVPFLGPLLLLPFWLSQMCCGVSKAHEKPMGQSIAALLMATLTPAFFIGLMLAMAK